MVNFSMQAIHNMYKEHKTAFRTLRPSDPGFRLQDGIYFAYRAGFEISNRCPEEYKLMLQECINYGWIKPIATVYDHELTFASLKYDHSITS